MGLYQVPEQFQERLRQEFGDKLRIRWSDYWNEWQVEQKIRRGKVGQPITRDRYHDDTVRYRDGYAWVMSIKQGTRFPCPTCEMPLSAPTRVTEMLSCRHCQLKGYEHHWIACHWPFDETLIDHFKKMEREIDDRSRLVKESEQKLKTQMQRQALEPTLAAFEDRFNKLAGIPSVGYTGRETMWER
jgi:hypothetical protein